MKYTFWTAPLVALAGFAFAGEQLPAPTERLQQLERDLPLIRILVQQGLTLAAEDDPLKRAQTCNLLAESLVREIQQAAGAREEKRAANLGNYLQDVLVRGVADNLLVARESLPQPLQREPELKRISDRAIEVTRPVAEDVRAAPAEEQKILQPAVEAASIGRAAVANAFKGKGRKAAPRNEE